MSHSIPPIYRSHYQTICTIGTPSNHHRTDDLKTLRGQVNDTIATRYLSISLTINRSHYPSHNRSYNLSISIPISQSIQRSTYQSLSEVRTSSSTRGACPRLGDRGNLRRRARRATRHLVRLPGDPVRMAGLAEVMIALLLNSLDSC